MVPAFVVGILAGFFALMSIINWGLVQIVKWQKGKSNLFNNMGNKPIIDTSMAKKLDNISSISALIIIAVVFYFISKGPAMSGIIVLYGLIGLGLFVGIASFLIPRSPAKARTTQQGIASNIQVTNKDEITKTLNLDGHLIYFVGEPAEDFLIFQCPRCDQYYACSKAKYNITYDCNKCKNTVQITRKPAM